MTNLEFYKDELIDILAEHTSVDRNGKPHTCDSVGCLDCAFSKKKNCQKATKEWLLVEHKEKIKLKQWEYDILKHCDNASRTYIQMKHLGYFKGTSDDLTIDEILSDYIIVSDDYEGFEETK